MSVQRTVRAAVHVHSEWSYDARWPLRKIADELSRRHYDVVLMADHDQGRDPDRWEEYRAACAAASTDSLLIVPGTEYADPANLVHLPVWGAPFLGEGLPTSEVLQRVAEHDGVAVLAHPSRRDAWRAFDRAWLPHVLGIELWNRKYDGWAIGAPARELLASCREIVAIASLDLHTQRQLFPLALELTIDGNLDEQTVLHALRARQCRATAFGQPLSLFIRPVVHAVAVSAERVRRPTAKRVRAVLERRGSRLLS